MNISQNVYFYFPIFLVEHNITQCVVTVNDMQRSLAIADYDVISNVLHRIVYLLINYFNYFTRF